MLDELTPAQRALAEYMRELSEEAYCAGWMSDLEYDLWECLTTERDWYGRMPITDSHKQHLLNLSNACAGWITYDWDSEHTFVSLAEWIDLYNQRLY